MAYCLPNNDGGTVLPTNDGGGQLRPPTQLLGCLHTLREPTPTSTTNPLLVAVVYTASSEATISSVDVKLVDVATGEMVARMDRQGNGHFGMTGDLFCLVGTGGHAAVSVFDLATCDVTNIPAYATGNLTSSAYVFGHVPATGEHKVLRVYAADDETNKQACEILTLGAGEEQRWRPAPSPPVRVGTWLSRHWAVTQGAAHFLIPQRLDYDIIASFDLATEKWRPEFIRCPLSLAERYSDYNLSLIELNGCLVFVYHDYRACAINMWVLRTDLDWKTWLRVEALPLTKVLRGVAGETKRLEDIPPGTLLLGAAETMALPLMVLEDGRIAFWVRAPYGRVVRVYNPRTGACLEVVGFGKLCCLVGLHRGDRPLGSRVV